MTCGEQYLDESLGELCGRAVSDELVVWQSAVVVTRRRVALGDLDERRRLVVDARVQLPVDVERPRQIDVVARRVRRQTVGRARRTLLLQLPAARRPACVRACAPNTPRLDSQTSYLPGSGETICPRRWQFDSRRIYVRPRTGPQSAHLWWPAVACQAVIVPIA